MSTNVLFDAPGPKARRRILIANVVGAALVLGILALVVLRFHEMGQFSAAKWSPFLTSSIWVDYLLPGLRSTLLAAVIAMVTSNIFGLVFGIGRLASNRWIRLVSGVIVEFFRAVPVLVMMIFFWFFFAKSGVIDASAAPFWAVICGLTLYNGSVMAELIRSGVLSLPRGQSEAGLSVGLTQGQTLTSILLPQALTAMMPSMVSQLVVILKDTALGQIITYSELLRASELVGTAFRTQIPALMVVALIFIIINFLLSRFADWLSLRLRSNTKIPVATLDPADEGLAPGIGIVHTGPVDPTTEEHQP